MKNKILILIPICIFLIVQAIFKTLFISFVVATISVFICLVITNKKYILKEKILLVGSIVSGVGGITFVFISLLPTLLSTFFSFLTLGVLPINKVYNTFMKMLSNNTFIILGIIGILLILISVILLCIFCKSVKNKNRNNTE